MAGQFLQVLFHGELSGRSKREKVLVRDDEGRERREILWGCLGVIICSTPPEDCREAEEVPDAAEYSNESTKIGKAESRYINCSHISTSVIKTTKALHLSVACS